jgi:hypothetical protein
MGIEPQFTAADVRKRFEKFLSTIEKRAIDRLAQLGEDCVTHARTIPASIGFTDRTGNLRASIGYVIFKDGMAVRAGYELPDAGGAEGMKAGKDLAMKVGAKHRKGLCLVVTAGMSYALAVEAKGRDVLASAEALAKQEAPKMLKKLQDNIIKSLT